MSDEVGQEASEPAAPASAATLTTGAASAASERRQSGSYASISRELSNSDAAQKGHQGKVKIELELSRHGAIGHTTAEYEATEEGHLSFIAGRLATNVVPTSTKGLVEGIIDGVSGLIPTDCIHIYDYDYGEGSGEGAGESGDDGENPMEKYSVNVPLPADGPAVKSSSGSREPKRLAGTSWAMYDPDIQGVVHKKGDRMGGWNKRFGVLEGGYFYVYKAQKDKEPSQVFDLVEYRVEPAESKKRAHSFDVVQETGKLYHYACDSADEYEVWMAKFAAAAKRLEPLIQRRAAAAAAIGASGGSLGGGRNRALTAPSKSGGAGSYDSSSGGDGGGSSVDVAAADPAAAALLLDGGGTTTGLDGLHDELGELLALNATLKTQADRVPILEAEIEKLRAKVASLESQLATATGGGGGGGSGSSGPVPGGAAAPAASAVKERKLSSAPTPAAAAADAE